MALSLPSKQGISRVDGDNVRPAVIADICYFRGSGNPTGVVTPNQAGDWYTDTTNGYEWLATGSTSSNWSLVSNGSPIVMTANVTIPLASIVAGNVTIVPAISGHTITPVYWKVIIAGILALIIIILLAKNIYQGVIKKESNLESEIEEEKSEIAKLKELLKKRD